MKITEKEVLLMSSNKALQIGNDLACIAKSLAELAEKMKVAYDTDHHAEEESTEVESMPEVKYPDIAEVRGFLAEKSRAGHTAEVQALLVKHRANKLSEIPPADYKVLMEEARAL